MNAIRKYTNNKFIYAVISVLLLCVIVWQVYINRAKLDELKSSWERLQEAPMTWIIIAVLCAPLGWTIESKKWQYMTQKFAQVSFYKSISSVMTGMSFAFVSPGKVGDFAGRMLYFDERSRWRAVVSVLISNMAHIMVTLLMGWIGSIVLLTYGGTWWQWLIFAISFVLLFSFGLLYFRLHKLNYGKYRSKQWLRKIVIALYLLKKYNVRDLVVICLYSFAKFCVYTIQYLIIAYLLGADIPLWSSFFIASVMFWMITVIPSFFVADIVLRGNIAHLLFITSGITYSVIPIISASYILWVINWILPSVIGAISLMVYRRVKKS